MLVRYYHIAHTDECKDEGHTKLLSKAPIWGNLISKKADVLPVCSGFDFWELPVTGDTTTFPVAMKYYSSGFK